MMTPWLVEWFKYSNNFYLFFIIILSGVRLSPLGTAVTIGLLYQSQMTDDGYCGAIGVMKIGRGNQSNQRKPTPVPLSLPQIPHDLTQGHCGGKPATNHLRYGMDLVINYFNFTS
jgi:hypothetical protein